MQTPKEALLARLKGEKADFIPELWTTHKNILFPGDRFIDFKNFDPYGTGPDAWGVLWTNQGPNPEIHGNTVAKNFNNDIDFVMENYGDKITIVGGLDNQMMERPGTTEEEIRKEIRQKMDKYVNKGRYLPFYIPTSEEVFAIYVDEVTKYGKEIIS